jgi:hypothetical protein
MKNRKEKVKVSYFRDALTKSSCEGLTSYGYPYQ